MAVEKQQETATASVTQRIHAMKTQFMKPTKETAGSGTYLQHAHARSHIHTHFKTYARSASTPQQAKATLAHNHPARFLHPLTLLALLLMKARA